VHRVVRFQIRAPAEIQVIISHAEQKTGRILPFSSVSSESTVPPENVEKMILRFRDLGIARGETIQQHRAILRDRGFVWWGW
jgi:hypothetical protein